MRAVIPFAIVAWAGCCTTALSDPRGDVLSRLSHCNALVDSRAWLDCYYAAAQPQRAVLGLPPAPQAPAFESFFVRPIPSGPVEPAVAMAPSTATPPAGRNEDSGGLFSMFDSYKVPAEQFGLVNARPGAGPNVDRVVDRLSSYSFPGGLFTVTLANGQVWRQTAGPRPNWRGAPANYTVTITHGAMRTFNLRVQEGPNVDSTFYKVARIH